MARSPFRLQSLLDHQRHLEEQKTLELATLTSGERRQRDALTALRAEGAVHLRGLESLVCDGAIDPDRYQAAAAYIDRLQQAIREQSGQLDEIVGRVAARRDELRAILQEKQSLERLRERQEAAAAVEDARREARVVDDLVTSRYTRRTSNGGS